MSSLSERRKFGYSSARCTKHETITYDATQAIAEIDSLSGELKKSLELSRSFDEALVWTRNVEERRSVEIQRRGTVMRCRRYCRDLNGAVGRLQTGIDRLCPSAAKAAEGQDAHGVERDMRELDLSRISPLMAMIGAPTATDPASRPIHRLFVQLSHRLLFLRRST